MRTTLRDSSLARLVARGRTRRIVEVNLDIYALDRNPVNLATRNAQTIQQPAGLGTAFRSAVLSCRVTVCWRNQDYGTSFRLLDNDPGSGMARFEFDVDRIAAVPLVTNASNDRDTRYGKHGECVAAPWAERVAMLIAGMNDQATARRGDICNGHRRVSGIDSQLYVHRPECLASCLAPVAERRDRSELVRPFVPGHLGKDVSKDTVRLEGAVSVQSVVIERYLNCRRWHRQLASR